MPGARGPAAGGLFRRHARIFGKLPTVQGAIRHAEVAAERVRRTAQGQQVENVIRSAADRIDATLAERVTQLSRMRQGSSSGNEVLDRASAEWTPEQLARKLDVMEKALADFALAVPKGVAKALTNAEQAVARGAAAVPVPDAKAGVIPGALGALGGGAYGGMERAVGAGAVGVLLGEVRARVAFRLSNNERFVRWATGLSPREPLAQAALSFITDVMAQAEDEQEVEDHKQFYDELLRYVEEMPEAALGLLGAQQ
jgi:hypothetical protein